jgi:hypothetical protein
MSRYLLVANVNNLDSLRYASVIDGVDMAATEAKDILDALSP